MFKNWKTTLLGIIGAVAMVLGGAAKDRASNPDAPPLTAGNLIPAIAVAAIGAAAKDHDVTGGERPQ